MNHIEPHLSLAASSPPENRAVRGYRNPYDNADRIAHNFAMRLKDSDQKFFGDLSQYWQNVLDEYEQISKDDQLDDSK